jgi:hypothetical protein
MKYLLILFSLCLTLSLKADIRNIPRRDINDIKSLFERLILAYDYGYTIFGSKPMSLADMCLKVPSGLPIHRQIKAQFLLIKSEGRLNAWYKYRSEFNFKDFIFLDEEEPTKCFSLILINKKNLLAVLHDHEPVFKQELGELFKPESFLAQLEKRELSLTKAIHNNHRLLGIMLGYGERNATLFQERFELIQEISKRKRENLPQDSELTKKLHVIEAQLSDFSEFEEDAIIPPLYFLADVSHPETIELKKRYENDRQKIEELTEKPNFQNEILRQLLR